MYMLSRLILALWFAVENAAHCDFVKLRNMLIRTHMQDLKDVTRETHYENYRAQCIQSMTRMVVKERNRKYALPVAPDKHFRLVPRNNSRNKFKV